MENPSVSDKNARGLAPTIFSLKILLAYRRRVWAIKGTLKPHVVPSVFSCMPPTKRRKTNETRIAQAAHHSIIDELLSPEPSHQEPELTPLTKEVGKQCGLLSINPLYSSVAR